MSIWGCSQSMDPVVCHVYGTAMIRHLFLKINPGYPLPFSLFSEYHGIKCALQLIDQFVNVLTLVYIRGRE
jgi:hypothetical protein